MKNKIAKNQPITNFTQSLLTWYQQNARPLPWRQTNDPYAIWVSEVMLQQTRVETVIPYYHRFLEQYPTITALAAAPEQEALKAWEGLGYYRRVRLLQQGAQQVVERFGGKLPADPKALASLPGVGSYMAGSLASIAFHLPVPAVDGNVVRVVTRVLAWEEDAATAGSRKMINAWVQAHFPESAIREFTESMMELGALICLPKKPHCRECPIRQHCQGVRRDPEQYPVKKSTRAIPVERRVVLRINWNGCHLLIQRPANGLLAGFWEYPNLLMKEKDDPLTLAKEWTKQHLSRTMQFQFIKTMTQTFTHRQWNIEVYHADWHEDAPPNKLKHGEWFLPDAEAVLPRVAFVRDLNQIKEKSS